MKYWAYPVGKLAVAAGILYPLRVAITRVFPELTPLQQDAWNRVNRDLPYTFTMLFYSLFAAGILWAIIWDQRYRCRTCLRRLRMPIQTGSWTNVLFGSPRTEYICLYGHGTLRVDELQITGRQEPNWEPHQDIWKELFSIENTKK